MPSPQPSGMHSSSGVILTVGIVSTLDRCAIVLPLATDDASLDRLTLCNDAIQQFMAFPMLDLLACISSDAHISFIQAEGMMDGAVPSRVDFAPTDHPGSRASVTIANNVAALAAFYADPADLAPGTRMRVAKNFIPGIAAQDVVNDLIIPALQSAIETFAADLLNGWASGGSGGKWYRVLAKASQTAVSELLHRIVEYVARRYVATQRRRLIPHS